VARDTFEALDCRDVARVDLRMTAKGEIYVIEVNPLPGLTPGYSDLCLIATAAGIDYRTLIGEILAGGLKRLREKRRAEAARSAEAQNRTDGGKADGRGEARNETKTDDRQLAIPRLSVNGAADRGGDRNAAVGGGGAAGAGGGAAASAASSPALASTPGPTVGAMPEPADGATPGPVPAAAPPSGTPALSVAASSPLE
jgi:D-alanine-D-alanine ligase